MYQQLKALIYPKKCIICRTILEQEHIGHVCSKCYSFVLRHHVCTKCGRPFEIGDAYCDYCKKEETSIERIVSLFPYEEKFKKAIFRWKYNGLRKYAKGYADLFANDLCIFETLKIDALIPVPLSPSRQRMRGFNQALDLANELSVLTGVKVYDILKRVKDTKPQSKCTKIERMQNIKNSIEMKEDFFCLKVNNLAIIDDIYTTGATVKECIRALNRQDMIKNKKIYVLTVCIGL